MTCRIAVVGMIFSVMSTLLVSPVNYALIKNRRLK
jgi:hypothetical protein